MSYQSFSTDFLSGLVAEAITKGQSQLQNLQYVFPNRRAGLFFARELKKAAQARPDFAVFMMPITQSLDEFACSISPLRQLDQTAQLFRLYQSYKTLHSQRQNQDQSKEEALSFDKFLFWGQMLLADYEQVSQAMAQPQKLFGVLLEQHKLDESMSPNEEEAEILADFLPRFKAQLADQSGEGFLSFWNLMLPLYQHFTQALIADKLAFPGLIMADALDKCSSHIFGADRRIIFAGFSQISIVQARLIANLLKLYPNSVSMRWDSHPFFVEDNKTNFQAAAALKTVRQNPLINQSLDQHLIQSRQELEKNGGAASQIHAIGCPLQISQVKHAAWLVADIAAKQDIALDRIAIVMPSSDLLFPLINSLPKIEREGYAINVTIGYSMRATPAFSLVGLLLDMQKGCEPDPARPDNFRYLRAALLPVLRHTYIMRTNPESISVLVNNVIKSNSLWIESSFISSQIVLDSLLSSKSSDLFNLIFEPKKQTGSVLAGWLYQILVMIYQYTSKQETQNLDTIELENDVENQDYQDNQTQYYQPNNVLASFDDAPQNQAEFSKQQKTDLVLEQEYLYHAGLQLARLQTTAQNYPIGQDIRLWSELIISFLQNTDIPFSGDPIRGIQIMGLLESQNLDFDYVILLDSGEAQMPPAQIKPSFIPQQIRKAFGLAQIQDTEAQYAYLISRLLYRSKQVYFLYESASPGSEKSRFLLQFEYIMGLKIHHSTLQNPAVSLQNLPIVIDKKSQLIADTLAQYGSGGTLSLSPSSLATYISCSLKFYYHYILKLKKPADPSENQDHFMIGNIVHQILKEALEYASDSDSKKIDPAKLEVYQPSIEPLAENLIKQYLKGFWQEEQLEGQQFLNKQIIVELATKFLDKQILECGQNPNIAVNMLEQELESMLNLDTKNADLASGFVRIKGKPDRIDKLENTYRISDYKTSTTAKTWKPKELQDLFDQEKDKKQAFQLMCYSWLLDKKLSEGLDIEAGLVWLAEQQTEGQDTSIIERLSIGKQADIVLNASLPEFELLLSGAIEQLFSSEIPFVQTPKITTCQYCDFIDICRRRKS